MSDQAKNIYIPRPSPFRPRSFDYIPKCCDTKEPSLKAVLGLKRRSETDTAITNTLCSVFINFVERKHVLDQEELTILGKLTPGVFHGIQGMHWGEKECNCLEEAQQFALTQL
jgi:hypothetical protein